MYQSLHVVEGESVDLRTRKWNPEILEGKKTSLNDPRMETDPPA